MEKTITIDDKPVRLRATASFLKIYNAQTGKDFIPTVMPIFDKMIDHSVSDAIHNIQGLQLIDVFNLVWALAKNADKDIPDPDAWLDSFENFPLDEVMPVVFELLLGTFFSVNFQKKTKIWMQNTKEKILSLRQDLSQVVSQGISLLETLTNSQ
jgi:prophage pi2 protein 40|nr:MAG TPA: tail assembly chaperone protein [Caudoviricetes sp.]